jgi:hypothetical protein
MFLNQSCYVLCGQPLSGHTLDANYYDLRDGQIWHVPAFCGLNHQCAVRTVPAGVSVRRH